MLYHKRGGSISQINVYGLESPIPAFLEFGCGRPAIKLANRDPGQGRGSVLLRSSRSKVFPVRAWIHIAYLWTSGWFVAEVNKNRNCKKPRLLNLHKERSIGGIDWIGRNNRNYDLYLRDRERWLMWCWRRGHWLRDKLIIIWWAPVMCWVLVSVDTIEGLIMRRLIAMPNIHKNHLIISMGELK